MDTTPVFEPAVKEESLNLQVSTIMQPSKKACRAAEDLAAWVPHKSTSIDCGDSWKSEECLICKQPSENLTWRWAFVMPCLKNSNISGFNELNTDVQNWALNHWISSLSLSSVGFGVDFALLYLDWSQQRFGEKSCIFISWRLGALSTPNSVPLPRAWLECLQLNVSPCALPPTRPG